MMVACNINEVYINYQSFRIYIVSISMITLSSLALNTSVYAGDGGIRDKTFILDFEHEGTHAQAKYYISNNDRVFFVFETKCGLIGSTAEMGHTGKSSIKCDGDYINNSLVTSFNKGLFKAREYQRVKSDGGNYQTIRDVSFSFDGLKCTPISYSFYLHNDNYASQGLRFDSNPISCNIFDGRN